MSKVLRLALCLYPDVTALDYQGPVELLGFLSPTGGLRKYVPSTCRYLIDITYFSHTMDPVELGAGPRVLPTRTYGDVKGDEQFDIIFIPGGAGGRPGNVPPPLEEFVKRQVHGAKYILTVCTGSWILASSGFLDGKRATTNKALFRDVKASTNDKITWVPKARWVTDGNVWTSSGVVAGMDMTNAFLTHLVGGEVTKTIRGIIELSEREQYDDEFAAVHGLE
ncbi:class I glutamine amidotransferase-like protein [Gautieria morchelliformis]|nr:class I glutamine amidotransferase-like protein [Gautieria morchelliformis]